MTTSPLDVRLGSQRPQLLLLPDGAVSSAGQEATDLAAEVGLYLDEWQQLCLDGLLGDRDNGQWAATEGAVVVSRQNGKNVIEEAGELAGLILFGEKLITHSAHLFTTAVEHFLRMRTLFEESSLLSPLVDDIYVANGKEAIVLQGGQRLRFIARSRGGGRGFTGDRVVFDEAYSLGAEAIGAMVPALSARSMEVPGPQIWYFSSAAHHDSAVLHNLRRRALAGAPRLAYFEWGNPPDVDWEDRDAWYAANPGLGIRISEEWIETELNAMRELGDEFPRERLGIASAEDAGALVFGAGKWSGAADEKSTIAGATSIAVDVGPQMAWASFAAAGARADGLLHVEMIERHPGTDWVVERAKELTAKWKVPIGLDPRGPAGGILPLLAEEKVPVVELPDGKMPRACASLQNGVQSGNIRHLGQAPLDAAVAGAATRQVGDAWVWARRTAAADITPLVACTVALWAHENLKTVDVSQHVW